MTTSSDYFQTALTMAHILNALPDGYRQAVDDLLERWTDKREAINEALERGLAPGVIEAFLETKQELNEQWMTWLGRTQAAWGAGMLVSALGVLKPRENITDETAKEIVITKARQLGMTEWNHGVAQILATVPRVTIAERRAKRRERRGNAVE